MTEEELKRAKCAGVKKKQHERRAKGLCRYCDSKPMPGLTSCERHLRARSRNWKRLSKKRKTVGICTRCSKPRKAGYSMCEKHIVWMQAHSRKSQAKRKTERQERKEAGLCSWCNKKAQKGRTTCLKHTRYFQSYEYKDSRKAYKCGRGRFSRARGSAVQRLGAENWTLTREEYEALVALPCVYCGFVNEGSGIGLDRIVNDRGYHKDNVVSCDYVCNTARNDHFTHEEMKTVIGPAIRQVKLAREQAKGEQSSAPQA